VLVRPFPLGAILSGRYYSAAQSVNGRVFVFTGNRLPPAHFPSEELAGDDCKLKKTLSSKKSKDTDDLKNEYRFDYRKAKPNRFAAAMSEGTVAVVLERDVAAVFKSSEAVNSFLRSAISAMPKPLRPKRVLTRR
jgi:hypothetical protein